MKHLTTLLTMAITFTGLAQQMPYNPDANGDDFVGVDDVLGVLGVYDTALMQPDLQCDYEGTEFENLIIGAVDGSIIIDSVYVEYLILDTATYFTPGCPDEVVEPIVLERSYVLVNSGPDGAMYSADEYTYYQLFSNHFSYSRRFTIVYNDQLNRFSMYLDDNEVGQLPNNSSNAYMDNSTQDYGSGYALPFPTDFYLDENGFQCFYQPYSWAVNAEYFRAIPFWHEAE